MGCTFIAATHIMESCDGTISVPADALVANMDQHSVLLLKCRYYIHVHWDHYKTQNARFSIVVLFFQCSGILLTLLLHPGA